MDVWGLMCCGFVMLCVRNVGIASVRSQVNTVRSHTYGGGVVGALFGCGGNDVDDMVSQTVTADVCKLRVAACELGHAQS